MQAISPVRRIAVWNTAFLGDAVLTLPLLRVLRAAWPDAILDFYVRGGMAPLFQAQPEISRVFTYDKRGTARGFSGFWLLGREVASRRYDVWIDAHLSLRSSIMARLSGAPVRIGYAEASLAWWTFTRQVGRRFRERQEIERLLALLDPLDLPESLTGDPELTWPELVLPASAHREADELMASLPPGPVLGVNPGSVWPTKRWTPEGFAHVMNRALDAGACVVLLSAPDEKDAAAEVLNLLAGLRRGKTGGKPAPEDPAAARDSGRGPWPRSRDGSDRLLDLSGRTSLPVLAAVLARLQCYLTNDSGPMHLAWAQRTPVTALFGPTVRELGFAPRGDSTVMETDEPCRPCGLHGHKACPRRHFRCMKRLDPEAVWRDVFARLYPWKAARDSAPRADGRAFSPEAGT